MSRKEIILYLFIAGIVLVNELTSSLGVGLCTFVPLMLVGLFAIWKYLPKDEAG